MHRLLESSGAKFWPKFFPASLVLHVQCSYQQHKIPNLQRVSMYLIMVLRTKVMMIFLALLIVEFFYVKYYKLKDITTKSVDWMNF